MSSYIISAKQFNTIEKNLIDLSINKELYFKPSEINKIMQSMREINIDSVINQYKGVFIKNIELHNAEKITPVKKISLIELYKLMRCLYYQVETIEDNKKEYFDQFKIILQLIANKIICSLPAYDHAPWSIG